MKIPFRTFYLYRQDPSEEGFLSTAKANTQQTLSTKNTTLPHLYKCHFTLANITVNVFNGHLPVVFNPALATEDVMDAGRHFVPLIVVPKSGETPHRLL